MTRIAEVPASFDDRTFDQFAQAFGAWPPEERMLFDARAAKWASPYGLVGILTAGQALREAHREKPLFTVPANEEVRSYWARTGFFRHAADLFEIHGKVPKVRTNEDSDQLLDITPVGASEDVHQVVGRIQERAARMLNHELGLEAKATMGFAMALSEACQNIVEHAGTSGWVAVHVYNWRKRLGRRVVVIAVSDAGLGFRRSLEATQAKRFGDRWGDCRGPRGGADPGREPVSRPRPGSGPRGHQAVPEPVGRQDLDPQRDGAAVHRAEMGRRPPARGAPALLPRLPGAGGHSGPGRRRPVIQTIPLGRVLRETVATPYRDLVTRPTGAAVRGWIQKAIAGSAAPTTLLDFTEVGLLDFSCADEIVAKLLLDTDPGSDQYVMLLGTRDDHTEAIDHVLNHHALAIAVVTEPGEPPRLLGRVTPELERVFRCVFRLGPGDAGSIAETLGWTLERAADALLTLALLRLLRAEAGTFQPLPR